MFKDIFESQLASVQGPILVVAEPGLLNKYAPAISDRKALTIVYFEPGTDLSAYVDMAFDLVICVGRDNPRTHLIYRAVDAFKRRDIPVVFGNPSRGLAFGPANWQAVDLNINGMFFLANAFTGGLKQKGDYVEFGVFDGRSFTIAWHSLKNSCRRFFAFDSFEGIIGAEVDETKQYVEGSYFANQVTFWHNLAVSGVDRDQVSAIPGPFQTTLRAMPTEYGIGPVSICHIDSDIYKAAYLALTFIKPVLHQGALILFDEYHAFAADPKRGERRAVGQWLKENPEVRLELYRNYTAFGAAFIYRTV